MQITHSNSFKILELEKANMVINQFVTSCSHSMRGPLKSIKGLVSLLHNNKEYSETDAIAFLDLIEQTAVKMENMLDELEQLLENSKRAITIKKIDWNEIIHAVLSRYTKEISNSDIKVETIINQNEDFFSDGLRLHLILSHLVENAIQFQDETKTPHSIHIVVEASPKNCIVRIYDNGIGINEEVQQKIFELFYRATQKSKGPGIGLYIVREAVEKMGGSIVVESVIDTGSVFTVTLPNLAA